MGLDRKTVEPWEDGSRVEGKRGEYEWWYYDSHYPDGTILVIFFYSKMPISVNGPIKPISSMELTLPDGTKNLNPYEPIKTVIIESNKYNIPIIINDTPLFKDTKVIEK